MAFVAALSRQSLAWRACRRFVGDEARVGRERREVKWAERVVHVTRVINSESRSVSRMASLRKRSCNFFYTC
ncbi:UNVERIFIED_CONTAM: hypothetical protein NY603_36290, partial [Bacteroidetes bacterium 56_B9]